MPLAPSKPLVLAVAAVTIAAVVGIALGAYWQSTVVHSIPAPQVVMAERFTVPAANYTVPFAAAGWGYWDPAFAEQNLSLTYDAPFPVDACLVEWFAPEGQGHFTDCTSLQGARILLGQNRGTLGFTVSSSADDGFGFFVQSPDLHAGVVNYSWLITSTSGTPLTASFVSNLTLPSAQFISEFDWTGAVSLPAGHTQVLVQAVASGPIGGFLFLRPYNGGAPASTSWNWTGTYSGPETMTVKLVSMLPVSADVALVVVVYDT